MNTSSEAPLYPLRFAPIFQFRLWGGRSLRARAGTLPGDGPVGEAWVLSDRADCPSRVANGPLEGRTIAELIARSLLAMLGDLASRFRCFPLLLKFLDVQKTLSVQAHPRGDQTALIPPGDTGKTEAWIVLAASAQARSYAALKPGTTPADLRALTVHTVDTHLASFAPHRGQSVLGGATPIDVTRPGIDKAYGIAKLHEILGIPIADMVFVGDALFPGGNDYLVPSIAVRDQHETKRVIEAIFACRS